MRLRLKDNVKKNIYLGLVFLILFLIAIFSIKSIVTMVKQKNNIEYKLEKHGYSEDDVKILVKNFNEKELDNLLNKKANKNITKFIKEKYYLKKNLDKYLTYYENNMDLTPTLVVALINTRSNEDWYTNPKDADTSKNNLLLVNKFNGLKEDYEPVLIDVSNWYSYGENNKLTEETYNAFKDMFNAAKADGLKIIATSCYRAYASQKRIYDTDVYQYGEEVTNESVAKPGFSEHQTGLAIDVLAPGTALSNFHETEEYQWLLNNAHLYGFILRYPEDKTNITGYAYESWHYRYVGKEVAKFIHENNITFDEYYAYYIAK
ncbi:MAG: M15 family metallopeptidase [Bacilli bacterium]|nr:M15 family metallopeptidase [Bacilli bacterium]